MGLESGEFLGDLDRENPVTATDPVSEGSNHLRLLKKVLQQTFPNYDEAVTVAPAELNSFPGSIDANAVQIALNVAAINDNAAAIGINIDAISVINAGATFKTINETIKASWQFDGPIRLFNDKALQGRNVANTGWLSLINVNVNDQTDIGNVGGNTRVNCFEQFIVRQDSVSIFTGVSRALGSLIIKDMNGTDHKAGFRNPQPLSKGGGGPFVQSEEGRVLTKTGGGPETYTVESLEVGTSISLLNDSNNILTIEADAGMDVQVLIGGDRIAAPFSLAPDSIMHLYWRTPTICRVWGNGLS